MNRCVCFGVSYCIVCSSFELRLFGSIGFSEFDIDIYGSFFSFVVIVVV